MKVSAHLPKLSFAIIDKSLPLIYGVGVILLVIRTLPPGEYGIFVLVQGTFYFLVNINQALILRPMVKYLSADIRNKSWIIAHSLILYMLIFGGLLTVISLLNNAIGRILHFPSFGEFLIFLWGLFIAFFIKAFSVAILNSRIKPEKVTIIDFIYFIGSLTGIIFLFSRDALQTAGDVLTVNILAALAASLSGLFMILPYLKGISLKLYPKNFSAIFRFGKYTFGAGLGTTLYQQSDNYIISALLSPVEVGVYNAAKTFMRFFNVLSQAIIMLIFPVISKLDAEKRSGDVKAVIEKGIGFYAIILYPAIILLIIFARPLFTLIYDGKYPHAYLVFQIILIGMIFHPFLSISSAGLLGLNKPKYNMYSKLVSVPANILMNFLLIPVIREAGAAVAIGVYAMLDAVFLFFYIKKFSGCTFSGVFLRYRDVLSFGKELFRRRI